MHDDTAGGAQGSPDADKAKPSPTPAMPDKDKPGAKRSTYPPDSIPDPMPGVDRQQTPGTDH